MIAETIPALQNLSPDEKLILAGELWAEIVAIPAALPPREDHLRIIQERLEHHQRHPEQVVAWDEVRARILRAR